MNVLIFRALVSLVLLVIATLPIAADETAFEKLTLTEEFHSEGIAIADIDGDGKTDVVSGPFWYQGPKFRKRFRYSGTSLEEDLRNPADRALSIKGYSQHFFTWTFDFNEDGHVDILTVGMPGDAAYWFQNPGQQQGQDRNWVKRKAFDDISNESPSFTDLTGDGKPELVCIHKGAYAYIQFKMAQGKVTFWHTPITKHLGYGRFTHGLGLGDVNGDGKSDLLETNGWWEQTLAGERFTFHPFRFAQGGGAQMFAYDFDGDGDNDVICSQNAHGFGLKWFEQVRSAGKIDFISRTIMTDQADDNPFGLAVSQMHAAALVDMDGDGIKDLVTGKRYWAHGGADPGSKQLPLLFWLKTIRQKGRVVFQPQLVDVRSGVGTQVTVGDINQDGKADIAVGNKLGTYLFLQDPAAKKMKWEDQPLLAGTKLFYENIRTSEPLTAEQQQRTFVLPQGFEIQLVAAEPDIAKPMNLAFDAKGRLWVSSSREYPFGAKKEAKGRDAIKILEDTNQDGRADKVITFADGLNIPMGLLPYGDGVICFSIPNIWYLRDTDGDDKVDKREILYGPFDTTRDTHGMCSSFRLGNDGWIYACHGFNNQSTVKGQDGHEVTMHSGNTFRFRPDGSRIEVVGRGQVNPFGMAIDSYGDIFTADCHTKPINLILPGGHHDSFGKPHDGLGYVPNVLEHLHDSTGIGGVVLGENTHFPLVYQRSTFGGNVVTGRVNRNHLIYNGSSMNAREESDFVIPGDPWFRPVNLQVGPDGALYIADFYNRIIGHYEVDLNHPGRDRERGRIWKVVYRGNPGRKDSNVVAGKKNDLANADAAKIMEEFSLANRSRSWEIVHWLESKRDSKLLEEVFHKALNPGKATSERAIYWLLITMKRVGDLTPGSLQIFLNSDFEKVRCLALQLLAEEDASEYSNGDLKRFLVGGLRDPSPMVQRFAALATSKHSWVDVVEELVNLLNAASRSGDRYLIHGTKIALRDQLRSEPERLIRAMASVEPTALGSLADICMALQTAKAAGFIVNHLEQLSQQNPDKLTAYLEFAARHAEESSIDSIVEIARNQFASDSKFQLAILDSLRTGIEQKQRDMPQSIRQLASAIALKKLKLPSQHWAVVKSGPTIPFAVRKLDIGNNTQKYFIDSLSRGETATGVLRSKPFRMTSDFQFRIAGHDGPKDELPKRNRVRFLLEDGGQFGTVFVPSSDTPVLVQIGKGDYEGQMVRLEIVDGSPRDSFGWIAVGDFKSNPELNAHADWSVDPEVDSLSWTHHRKESDETSTGENIFVLSTRRRSSDGMQETPLWSSIVKGEKRSGVYRSEPFVLDSSFRFFLAGHDGFPDKPLNQLNYVQLKLASSGRVVFKASPPRNDTAQPVAWDTSKWKGQKAYVEIVDQDTANAFAWLAAGRFSVPGLNPTKTSGDRIQASQIIARFKLVGLEPEVIRLIETTKSPSLKGQLSKTLISLSSRKLDYRSLLEVSAYLVSFAKSDSQTVDAAVQSIQKRNLALAKQVISNSLKKMTVAEQTRVAEQLSADRVGAEFLMESIEQGSMAIDVLAKSVLLDKLKAHDLANLNLKLDRLAGQIPKVDAAVLKLLAERKHLITTRKTNAANGKLVFEKNCSNCHQLGGAGKQVGPNLDGIGNRGLDRLLDDILVPNRNVDAAFRATLIATEDGRVINGLVKKGTETDEAISVVDNKGNVTLIAKNEIEKQKETKSSPMPANFGETLTADDFADLIGFLLSSQK